EQTPCRPAIREAEHLAYMISTHVRAAIITHGGMSNGLIENRLPVARRTFRRRCDKPQRIVISDDAFLPADHAEVLSKQFDRDTSEVKTLTARQYGDRNLVHLGGGEQ